MPQDKLIDYAYNNYNKYINDFYSIVSSDTSDIMAKAIGEYYYALVNGLDDNGTLKPNFELFYTQGPEAFKRLIKYATYINKNPNNPSAEQLATLASMCETLRKTDYSGVVTIYDAVFSDQDWEMVKEYFTENPEAVYAGSANDLMYSYIKSENKITRRTANLGFGAFGRTRSGDTEEISNEKLAIKRQIKKPLGNYSDKQKIAFANQLLDINKQKLKKHIAEGNAGDSEVRSLEAILTKYTDANTQFESIIDELYWLPAIQQEARFNYDLRVATSNLVIRRNPDGTIYKVYQEMVDIGISLEDYLRTHQLSDEERFELAIKLLKLTDDLHTGKLSISGTPYAHRDIKEANILIDKNGDLHFIDFGFTIDKNLDAEHITQQGSPEYVPISFNPQNVNEAFQAIDELRIEVTPSYFFDDKVAVRRTIYHQAFKNGILTRSLFNNLPDPIWELICSHDIGYLKQVDSDNSLKYIAAGLISYECAPELCTRESLENLAKDPNIQEQIINEYTKTRQKSRGKDLAAIQELLLNNEISIDYLPHIYRVHTNMEPSYLQFLLANNLLTTTSMVKLSARLNTIIYGNDLERPLILSILDNQSFLTHHLQTASREDLNRLLATLSVHNILDKDELIDLHVECFALNVIVPAVMNTTDLGEVFYKLAHKAIFTSDVQDTSFLERICGKLASNDDEVPFRVDLATRLLEQTLILKPSIKKNEQQQTPTDKFIHRLIELSQKCLSDLDKLQGNDFTQEYENTKIVFALIIELNIAINELVSEKIDEEEFFYKVENISTIYQEYINNNENLQELFYPKDKKHRVSPISVTKHGIFESPPTNAVKIVDNNLDKNDSNDANTQLNKK